MKKLVIMVSILLVLVIILSGCSRPATTPAANTPPAQPAPVTLKIGSLPRIFDLVLYAAQQDGVFEKNNLRVEIVPFASVLERNNAFLAGQLDGFVDSIYEAINMNKEVLNCKVAGHNLMPGMFKIVAAPKSGITQPAHLKGAKIATSTGTIMDYALDKLLASQGISSNDVTYVNVPRMPLRLTMLESGDVTAAILTPPLSEQAIASGNRLILDDSTLLLAGPALIFNLNTVNNQPQAIRNFVKSWNEEVALINAGTEKYRTLLVKTAQVPEGLASSYVIPVFPEVRLPTPDEVASMSHWMKSKGLIPTDASYDNLVFK
ncbi:MAG TPA: ABC transporter substrate-binding protein [Dehalococcoidales bacterium]|nr:ABC transporter substrate-binding protein [Dehalococcoidales bacterium]